MKAKWHIVADTQMMWRSCNGARRWCKKTKYVITLRDKQNTLSREHRLLHEALTISQLFTRVL